MDWVGKPRALSPCPLPVGVGVRGWGLRAEARPRVRCAGSLGLAEASDGKVRFSARYRAPSHKGRGNVFEWAERAAGHRGPTT